MVQRYLIALGSNRRHARFGRPEQVLGEALDALDAAGIVVTAADQGGNYFHTLMVNKLLTAGRCSDGIGGKPPEPVYEDLHYSRHFLPGGPQAGRVIGKSARVGRHRKRQGRPILTDRSPLKRLYRNACRASEHFR